MRSSQRAAEKPRKTAPAKGIHSISLSRERALGLNSGKKVVPARPLARQPALLVCVLWVIIFFYSEAASAPKSRSSEKLIHGGGAFWACISAII